VQHGSAKPDRKPPVAAATRIISSSLPLFTLAPKTKTGSFLEPAAFPIPITGITLPS
jgi:hypothetical protein